MGEVEVDVELVTGQGALGVGVAEQPDHPALITVIWASRCRPAATALDVARDSQLSPTSPSVSSMTASDQQLARQPLGPSYDEGQRARLGRRGAQVVEGGLQLGDGSVRHGSILPSRTAPVAPIPAVYA